MDDACRDFVPGRFIGQDSCGAIPSVSLSESSSLSSESISSSSSSSSVGITYLCFDGTICTDFTDPTNDQYLFWNTVAAGNDRSNANLHSANIALGGGPSDSCESLSIGASNYAMAIGDGEIWALRACNDDIVGWNHRIQADMQFDAGTSCGLLLDWHTIDAGSALTASYYMVVINTPAKRLEVWWYPGKEPAVLVGVRSFAPYMIDSSLWYRWDVYITEVNDEPFTTAIINIVLRGTNDSAFPQLSYSFSTRSYAKYAVHGFASFPGGTGSVSWVSVS
jgi:hypothetical protein